METRNEEAADLEGDLRKAVYHVETGKQEETIMEEFLSEVENNFTMIPNETYEFGLSPSEIAILHRIFLRAGTKGGTCFESRASMAKACGMSVRTVTTVFESLERLSIIEVLCRKGQHKPNLIRIKSIAQWKSKTQILQDEGGASANIASELVQILPVSCATIAHGTISIELDPIELDSLNTVTPEKSVVALKKPTPGSQVYEAYAEAFENRYNTQPIRNAKVNAICSQIAQQVGLQEAKAIMHFYLQQNVAWYVQKGHAIEYALKDLQALRTNMLNNKSMSSREAQQVDKQQAQVNALQNYLAKREKNVIK